MANTKVPRAAFQFCATWQYGPIDFFMTDLNHALTSNILQLSNRGGVIASRLDDQQVFQIFVPPPSTPRICMVQRYDIHQTPFIPKNEQYVVPTL